MGYQNFFATRLFTDIGASDTTITLENPPTPVEGYLVLEARNTSKREIISYTGVSGNDITGVARGQGGTTATDHSKNALVEMNLVAEDLEAALAVPDDIITRFDEVVSDHVASGLVWTDDTGLNADMSAGVAYINGIRLPISLVANHAFTASKDTYVDLGDNGVLDYNEVSNGAAAPSLAASHIRLARVDTDGSNTTVVVNFSNSSSLAKADGWQPLGIAQSGTIVNNGNRSYDIPFATTVAGVLTPGMRLRIPRNIPAPKKCAQLVASSLQYFSKTTPAGVALGTTWSMEAWVKLATYTGNAAIINRYPGGATVGWGGEVNSDGTIQTFAGATSASDDVYSRRSVGLDEWVHVATTMNVTTNTYTMYINGIAVSTSAAATAATAIADSGDLLLGKRADGAFYFNGKMKEVRLWDDVRTEAEIRENMNQELTGSEGGLIGYWKLEDDLNDSTANANHMTANGGATVGVADSPFGLDANGVAGDYEYAIVSKVNGSTATVQVPEGCAIPTSGGVGNIDYSTQKAPFGFPTAVGRWSLESIYILSITGIAIAAIDQWSGYTSAAITVPVGAWKLVHIGAYLQRSTAARAIEATFTMTSTSILPVVNAVYSHPLSIRAYSHASVTALVTPVYIETEVVLPTATAFYPACQIPAASGTETWEIVGARGRVSYKAEFGYL